MVTTRRSEAHYERRRQLVLLGLGKALIDYRNTLQRAKEACLSYASVAGSEEGLGEPLQR